MHHTIRRLSPSRIINKPRRARHAIMLAAAAAALSTTLGLASSASAASEYVALIPKVAPKVDVAQGTAFPTVARDSSGLSRAELWKITPLGNGYVIIVNRLSEDGPTLMALDVQDTNTVSNGPANAGEGTPVGTSPFDGSSTQQWKEERETFGKVYDHSTFTNRHTGRRLTFNGSGAVPAYSQKKDGGGFPVMSEFVVKPLG